MGKKEPAAFSSVRRMYLNFFTSSGVFSRHPMRYFMRPNIGEINPL